MSKVLARLESIQKEFNKDLTGGKKISLVNTIVLAGNAAIEKAARDAGYKNIELPFVPRRIDATQEKTDVNSFAALAPTAGGFRNYFASNNYKTFTEMLLDKVSFLI